MDRLKYKLSRSRLWPLVRPRWWAKQKLAGPDSRYYGDGGTIHHTTELDVSTYNGRVVSVWFRCCALPFRQHEVDATRAAEMDRMYAGGDIPTLTGVEVREGDVRKEAAHHGPFDVRFDTWIGTGQPTPAAWTQWFCREMNVGPECLVSRIEWRYLDEAKR